jgi:CBS domain-containing protein
MVEESLIQKRYVAVDKSDTISHLIGQLKQNKAKAALVFDKNKFIGIADTHLLIKTKLDPTSMKVDKIVKKIPVLNGKEELGEVARLLLTSDTRMLPVIDHEKVIGVINSLDVIKQLHNTEAGKKKLKEVMTLSPITIHENDRLGKAIEIMKENHVSRIPIVNDKGELVQIAALTDLLYDYTLRLQSRSDARGKGMLSQHGPRTSRAYGDKTELNAYPIKNISTLIIITASPDDTIGRTIDKMERFDISSIVVVEGKRPVGIIATRDLLKLLLKHQVTY